MTAREIKNKMESISYMNNRYFKNGALNICDEMLKSNFLNESEKENVQNIKLEIVINKNTWSWDGKPNYESFKIILNFVNELHAML